ncbi:hypothetical protein EVA_00499, partial [gut metagenome]
MRGQQRLRTQDQGIQEFGGGLCLG